MVLDSVTRPARRGVLAGMAASSALLLAGCQSLPPLSLTEAIRRLLVEASRRAMAQLTAPGGFWDDQVARLDLPSAFGGKGVILQAILSSSAVRERLRRELNHMAERGARRVAPVLADAVRVIGIRNAEALVRGGPTAATDFLRGEMGPRLIDEMVPELGDALRIAKDPLVGQAIAALAGIDVNGVARQLSQEADASIWRAIGQEEAGIRANPQSTNDPMLIAVFKAV